MPAKALSVLALSLSLFLATAASGASEQPGANAVSRCRKLPTGKRILKLEIKPDSEVADLIGWMSTITCTPFDTGGRDLKGKKVTVRTGGRLLTVEEAYQLFLDALGSVGLTVQPGPAGADGKSGTLMIVEKPPR